MQLFENPLEQRRHYGMVAIAVSSWTSIHARGKEEGRSTIVEKRSLVQHADILEYNTTSALGRFRWKRDKNEPAYLIALMTATLALTTCDWSLLFSMFFTAATTVGRLLLRTVKALPPSMSPAVRKPFRALS